MPEKSSKLNIFFAELKRRRVTRLATVYAVVGLGVIEAVDIIVGRFLIPEWIIQLFIIFVIVGFPIAMILGWIFDITSKGIQRTESLTPQEQISLPQLTWKPSWISIIMFILLVALSVTYCTVPRPNALGFSKQDWILICDLENNTKDELFDQSLLHALTVTIDQSRYVSIFPRNRIIEVLQRMRIDSIIKIDTPIALEIAERENIKTVLSLTISELSGTYLLSTRLLNPNTGEAIRSHQVIAKNKEEILKVMDKLASKVRKDLGESLNKIHLQSVSLPEATTSSLDALKCLVKGSEAWANDGKLDEAEDLLLEAIRLDPEFALAHADLGSLYFWESNRVKGEEHFAQALNLSERLTEKEKLWIQARIERFRGNQDEAILKYRIYLRKYPNSSDAWFSLGYSYMMLQRYEEAIDAFNKSLEIYQDKNPNVYINIASCYSLLQKYQQSINYYLKAFELNSNLLTVPNLNHEFGFTYVQIGEIEEAQEIFRKMIDGQGEHKAKGYRSQALLLMYTGKFSEAISHLHKSTLIYKTLGNGISELRDRLYLATAYKTKGMMTEFYKELNKASELISTEGLEPWWFLLFAKFHVRSGDAQKADSILNEISTKIIEGNKVDKAAFNILKGEIELAKGNHTEAIELFETGIDLRYDGYILESLANYYYNTGDLDMAISKYREIINLQNSLGWEAQEYWIQAHYNLAKIYEEKGDNEQAVKHYQNFLNVWKNGDEDLPELIDAKNRLAELQILSE